MINPEALDLSALPYVPLEARSRLPAQPGIYFAIDHLGAVQYIGRSSDVQKRWRSHHKYKDLSLLDGVKIAYLFVDALELLPSIETALIEWFKPPLNCESAQFSGKGIGVRYGDRPICVKLPADVRSVIEVLPDRSAKLRQWIVEGMKREGLLPD